MNPQIFMNTTKDFIRKKSSYQKDVVDAESGQGLEGWLKKFWRLLNKPTEWSAAHQAHVNWVK